MVDFGSATLVGNDYRTKFLLAFFFGSIHLPDFSHS